MATLLHKLRNHQTFPAMQREERDAEYGTYPPKVKRASLTSNTQRHATVKATNPARAQNDDKSQVPTRMTDNLRDDGPITNPPVPIKGNGNYSSYQPQAGRAPFGKIIVMGVCYLFGLATLLYTILFFLIAGCLLFTNLINYGPTHTAVTDTTINGQPTTIQTSNVHGTIMVNFITTGKDGTISEKTYTGPALVASSWNNDLDGIIATTEVGKGTFPTITIHLTGGMNYFHLLFTRPHMDFSLTPDSKGIYTIMGTP